MLRLRALHVPMAQLRAGLEYLRYCLGLQFRARRPWEFEERSAKISESGVSLHLIIEHIHV